MGETNAQESFDLGPANMRKETKRARMSAASAVSSAFRRARVSAGDDGMVRIEVCRRRVIGAPVPTGAVEGLALAPALTRHSYAHAFRCLERSGLASCEWHLADGEKMPLTVSCKASDVARIERFLALGEVPAGSFYDPRAGSAKVGEKKVSQRRACGKAIAEAFLAASRARRSETIALQVFDGAGEKRSKEAKASGFPDFRQVSKKTRPSWHHAFAAAEEAGFVPPPTV